MFVRRRPLLRAAVIGGGAYVVGKKSGERSASQDQTAQTSAPSGSQPDGAAAAQPATGSVSDQLSQISALHEQGSLSDAEFAAAKQKLLGA
jgi:hypothetical protein